MKIYSNKLTAGDLQRALYGNREVLGEVYFIEPVREFKPQLDYERGFEVYLGTGREGGYRSSHDGSWGAATWDEWGAFIATLYALDPQARIGMYHDADHFYAWTGEYVWSAHAQRSGYEAQWLDGDVYVPRKED